MGIRTEQERILRLDKRYKDLVALVYDLKCMLKGSSTSEEWQRICNLLGKKFFRNVVDLTLNYAEEKLRQLEKYNDINYRRIYEQETS